MKVGNSRFSVIRAMRVICGSIPQSKLRPNPARAHETPPAHRLKNREQTQPHQHQTNPKFKVRHDDPGDEQQRTPNAPGNPAAPINVTAKKTAHEKLVAQSTRQANELPQLDAGRTSNFGAVSSCGELV
jgi:hypothetical protein